MMMEDDALTMEMAQILVDLYRAWNKRPAAAGLAKFHLPDGMQSEMLRKMEAEGGNDEIKILRMTRMNARLMLRGSPVVMSHCCLRFFTYASGERGRNRLLRPEFGSRIVSRPRIRTLSRLLFKRRYSMPRIP